MKLSSLLFGLALVVRIAHGAAGEEWGGLRPSRAAAPTLKQAAT
jgi:hypothetical protein